MLPIRFRPVRAAALATIGLASLLCGLVTPDGMLATGQVDPLDWTLPVLVALPLILWVLRRCRWPVRLMAAVMLLVLPPLSLCTVASQGQQERVSTWAHARSTSSAAARAGAPIPVAVLSGPRLFGPGSGHGIQPFAVHPLWRVLSRSFQLRAIDSPDLASLRAVGRLLVIQPYGLTPEALVFLDGWVRAGGQLVMFADPAMRWNDDAAAGHALPGNVAVRPILTHWNLVLHDARPVPNGHDPVERRLLSTGRMVQLAQPGYLDATSPDCVVAERGLIARCRIGRGQATVVADADMLHASLWTTDQENPANTVKWSSDAPAVLIDLLHSGAGGPMGRRIWLTAADGVPTALRVALLVLLIGAVAASCSCRAAGEENKSRLNSS